MVKPEKFGHLHLVYHFTVPLSKYVFSKVIECLEQNIWKKKKKSIAKDYQVQNKRTGYKIF